MGEDGRPVDNVDALPANQPKAYDSFGTVPPGYVEGYDDGRPKH